MKKQSVTVTEMTPAAVKRTIWRAGKAYRNIRYAGAVRLVPCVDANGKQWTKPQEPTRLDSAAKLAETRKLLGLTQVEMAAAVGVKPDTVAKWEQGVRSPSGSARKLIKKLVEEGKKIRGYSDEDSAAIVRIAMDRGMNLDEINRYANCDYLTMNKARNGRYVVWYLDNESEWAVYADTDEELSPDEIVEQLAN